LHLPDSGDPRHQPRGLRAVTGADRFIVTKEGLSKKEIIRCLKRYVAREVYRHLRAAG
jgi:hypothetical protein